jgi:hypothetical protein
MDKRRKEKGETARLWKKCALGFVVTTAMALSVLPVTVRAAESRYLTGDGATAVSYAVDLLHKDMETIDPENVTATPVTSGTTTLTDGTYIVDSDVTIYGGITVTGNVNLILSSGCTLTVSGGINVSEGNGLAIYGKGDDTGKLIATGTSKQAGIGGGDGQSAGEIIIYGGTINATGGYYAAGIGGGNKGKGGTVTIKGGIVTATGGNNGAGIGGGDNGLGVTVTIDAGTVTATGGEYAPGIGRGSNGDYSSEGYEGVITINGGTVTATGGWQGSGIGGGYYAKAGDIIINGGTVTATGGQYAAGIGGGREVTGTVDFSTGENGTALIMASSIGSDEYKSSNSTSGIIIDGTTGNVYGNQTLSSDVTISEGTTLTIPAGTALTISEGVTLTNNGTITSNGIITNNGEITNGGTITNDGMITNDGDIANDGTITNNGEINNDGTITNGDTITINGTISNNDTIINYGTIYCDDLFENAGTIYNSGSLACSGGSVYTLTTLSDVPYIDADGSSQTADNAINLSDYISNVSTTLISGWYVVTGTDTGAMGTSPYTIDISDRIAVSGDVHLILDDDYTLNADKGINVSKGNSLTIYGQTNQTGALTIDSVDDGFAGIGGNQNETAGTITICGGTVEARGGRFAAGIGGGTDMRSSSGGSGGTVIVYGGTVKAYGGTNGAGIGGAEYGSGGTVSIKGGTVEATGGSLAAGIGGGYCNNGGEVNVSNGKVTANGGSCAAGIGGGVHGLGGTVNISNGTVIANGGTEGAGIGGGSSTYGSSVTVSISGGTVTATGGSMAAGIGGGAESSGGTVSISGGIVTATAVENATGIGCGDSYMGDTLAPGTFSTTSTGTAIIHTTSISDTSYIEDSSTSAIIFIGDEGQVYGGSDNWFRLVSELEVTKDETLIIPEGVTLYPYNKGTLTNSGTIINKYTIANTNAVTNNGIIVMVNDVELDINGSGTLRYKVTTGDLPEKCGISILTYGTMDISYYDDDNDGEEDKYVQSGATLEVESSVHTESSYDCLGNWVVSGERQSTNAADTLRYTIKKKAVIISYGLHTHDWTIVKNGDSTEDVLSQIDSLLKTKYGIDGSKAEYYYDPFMYPESDEYINYKNYQSEYNSYENYFANYSDSTENSSYATIVCLGDNDCNVNYSYGTVDLSRIGGELKLSVTGGQTFTYNAKNQIPEMSLSTFDENTGVTSLTAEDIVYTKYDDDSQSFKTFTDDGGEPVNAGTYRAELTLSREDSPVGEPVTVYSDTWEITPVEVTPSITGTLNKDYDGTTDVNRDVEISLSGVIKADEEKVSATPNTLVYDSANASENDGATRITATGITLTGDKADNYTLSLTGAEAGATINQKNISDATIELGTSLTYNGEEQTQTIKSVTVDELTLTSDDYTVVNDTDKAKDADTYKLAINGKGNFIGTASTPFVVAKKTLTPEITGTTEKVYDGTTTVNKDVAISLNGVVADDEVSATAKAFAYDSADATNATAEGTTGATKITATAIELNGDSKDNYELSATEASVDAKITKADPGLTVGDFIWYTYGDKDIILSPRYSGDGKITYEVTGTDKNVATVDANGNVAFIGAGSTIITVTLAETTNYKGDSKAVTVAVSQVSIETCNISLTLPDGGYTYDGTEKTPTVTVEFKGNKLTEKTDYEVSYDNNVNVGTATVTVTGIGNFAGEVEKTFTISQAQNKWVDEPADLSWTYGDGSVVPEYTADFGTVTVKYANTDANGNIVEDSISDKAPASAGTYKVIATVAADADGNYTGLEKTVTLTISPKELTPSIDYVGTKVYDGTTDVTGAKISLAGVVKGDEDYVSATATFAYDSESATTVDEESGKKNGATKVTATGITLDGDKKANYKLTTDEVDTDATITQIANEWVTGKAPAITGWTYGDKANAPTFEAKYGNNTAKIEYRKNDADEEAGESAETDEADAEVGTEVAQADEETDATADGYTTEVPTEAGNYTVRVTIPATDDYGVLVSDGVEFTIAQKDITGATVTLGDELTYTGEEQTQTVTGVSVGDTAVTTYDVSGNAQTNAGTYTLTVTGTGNFTGSATAEFTIKKAAKAPDAPASALTPEHTVKTVADVNLPTGWQWSENDKNTELADNEAVTATANYIGKDAGNYETESVEITITRQPCEHKGGTATCTAQAVCTKCNEPYGDEDATNHTDVVEKVGAKEATCTDDGYTGDTKCNDCGATIKQGETVKATGHTGGTATCVSGAICENCGTEYTEKNAENHTGIEEKVGAKEASCTEDGYTGDTKCTDCGAIIKQGEAIAATGHTGGTATCVSGAMCENCGTEYTEENAENHTGKTEVVNKKAAT